MNSTTRQHYLIKDHGDRFPDLSYTSLTETKAKDLDDGMWCIHSKSGFTGQIQNYNKVYSGKRGNKKIVYDLKYPHNNKTARESCSAKTMVSKCSVKKISYLVSHIERTSIGSDALIEAEDKSHKLVFGYIRIGSKWNDGMYEVKALCLKYYNEISYIYDLVCFDENYESMEFPLPSQKENGRLFRKILDHVDRGQEEGKDCYVTVLECPKINGKKVVMIHMIYDIRLEET